MGTDITPTGRYVVVCDICGIGFDTLSLTQSAAAWLAGLAGWSIDFPAGDELCPICAERRAEPVWQPDGPGVVLSLADMRGVL